MQERNSDFDPPGPRPVWARWGGASVPPGPPPPRLSAAGLVQLCARFGISSGTTRVALSRMVAAGELAAEEGHYRLVGEALLARQRAQDAGLAPPAGPWQGGGRVGRGGGARRGPGGPLGV